MPLNLQGETGSASGNPARPRPGPADPGQPSSELSSPNRGVGIRFTRGAVPRTGGSLPGGTGCGNPRPVTKGGSYRKGQGENCSEKGRATRGENKAGTGLRHGPDGTGVLWLAGAGPGRWGKKLSGGGGWNESRANPGDQGARDETSEHGASDEGRSEGPKNPRVLAATKLGPRKYTGGRVGDRTKGRPETVQSGGGRALYATQGYGKGWGPQTWPGEGAGGFEKFAKKNRGMVIRRHQTVHLTPGCLPMGGF